MDRDSFTRYSTALKVRIIITFWFEYLLVLEFIQKLAQLREQKDELEGYHAGLVNGITQLFTLLQTPESNPLIKALQQEANSCSLKLHDVVSYIVSTF